MSSHAQHIVSDLQRGRLSKSQAVGLFKDSLIQHETAAFVAGRRARGDLRPDVSPQEERMLERRHLRNMSYFRSFADDVVQGAGRMNYHQRAGLYGKSLWSLYTRGETSDFSNPDDYSANYFWVMDPDAEHCSSIDPNRLGCIQRSLMSNVSEGLSWEVLSEIGWPGEASPCMVECHCHIRVVHKRSPLPADILDIPPASTPEGGFKTIEELLGGPLMPLPLPAAGVPYVKVPPPVVANALSAATNGAELGRMLPLLPATLAMPEGLAERGMTRVYTRDNLVAAIQRSLEGIWQLVLLTLLTQQKPEPARS